MLSQLIRLRSLPLRRPCFVQQVNATFFFKNPKKQKKTKKIIYKKRVFVFVFVFFWEEGDGGRAVMAPSSCRLASSHNPE
jgi:hypothetical protein